VGLAAFFAWPPEVPADVYDDSVALAEKFWNEGSKTEAVQLYGRVWNQRSEDMDRQILYAERSAEVGNFRWAINFLKVAEPKVKDDPTRLYRVYQTYVRVYRMAGQPNMAQPWDEKAAELRNSGRVKDVPPRRASSEGFYVEEKKKQAATKPEDKATTKPAGTEPAPPGVAVAKPPARYLKKRIAVAPIGVAVGGAGLAGYGNQIQAMLITELRNTNRFIVVERENLGGLLAEQDLAASGRVAKGTGPKTGNLMGAQLMVKAEITDFDDQSQSGRRFGIGPVDVGRSQSAVRVAMDMRIYDAESGVVIASESVSAQKVTTGKEVGVDVGYFRFDDQKSQSSTLGFVTRELIQKALERIVADSAKVPWSARIIKAAGDEVYFNAGSDMGVRLGGKFKVVSVGETLTDPDTGAVLSSEEKPVGEIEVTRADEKFSVGRVVSKKGEIKRLDKVTEMP
jgi:curli biogenesis system outer membrane secretion channel CsgG